MKSKVLITILIISLATSIYYNVKNIIDNDRKKRVVFNFTLAYVNDINQGLKQLENCRSTGDYRNFYSITRYVVDNLYSLDQLLSDASYLVNEKDFYISGSHDFKQIGSAIEGGLKDKGYQGSLTEDGVLSENEIKFVSQLSRDLESLSSAIVGKDRLNVNPNLTVEEFTNALKAFSDKWNINYGRSESGFSPFDYLIG